MRLNHLLFMLCPGCQQGEACSPAQDKWAQTIDCTFIIFPVKKQSTHVLCLYQDKRANKKYPSVFYKILQHNICRLSLGGHYVYQLLVPQQHDCTVSLLWRVQFSVHASHANPIHFQHTHEVSMGGYEWLDYFMFRTAIMPSLVIFSSIWVMHVTCTGSSEGKKCTACWQPQQVK